MARKAKRFDALADTQGRHVHDASHKVWRVGLYARLSRDIDERKGESIENQISIMKDFVKDRPELADCREYTDLGFTGTNFDRPGFVRLMDDVKSGRINCIIVKDLSRFGRDYLETTKYIEVILPFLEVRLISVNDRFDTAEGNHTGKELEVAIKNLANDMYAKDISKKVSSVLAQGIAQGKVTNGRAPYGYRIDRDDPLHRYVVDEEAAAVVWEIFSMADNGCGLRGIVRWLFENRYCSPLDYHRSGSLRYQDGEEKKPWHTPTVSFLLANEAYIGRLAQGKYRARMYDNEKCRRMGKEHWRVTEDAHEPIISEELFFRVREKLSGRKAVCLLDEEALSGFVESEDRYDGLFYCSKCGRKMIYSHRYRKGKDGAIRYLYYACTNRTGHPDGKTVSIREALLDAAIMDRIRMEAKRLSDKGITAERCGVALSEMIRKREGAVLRIKERKERMERKHADLYESYVLGRVGRDAYLTEHDSYLKEIGAATKEISAAEDELAGFRQWTMRCAGAVRGLFQANGKKIPERELLLSVIERIEFLGDRKLAVRWRFCDEEGCDVSSVIEGG